MEEGAERTETDAASRDAGASSRPKLHRRFARHVVDHVAGADDDRDAESDFAALRQSYRRASRDFFGPDSYLGVFVLALASVVVVPIDEVMIYGKVVTVLLFGWLILLTFRKSRVRRPFRIAAAAITAVAAAAAALPPLVSDPETLRWLAAVISFLMLLLLGMCLPAILRRAFTHRRVTLNTVAAALAGYLLIGLFFTTLFTFIGHVQSSPFFVQLAAPQGFDYEYFAFVTMTTVGYGDLTAATNAGKSTAVLLALIGQIYLVTTVAAVVSNLGRERPPPAEIRGGESSGPSPGADDADG